MEVGDIYIMSRNYLSLFICCKSGMICMRKKEILLFATTWMNPKSEEGKYFTSLIYVTLKQ